MYHVLYLRMPGMLLPHIHGKSPGSVLFCAQWLLPRMLSCPMHDLTEGPSALDCCLGVM